MHKEIIVDGVVYIPKKVYDDSYISDTSNGRGINAFNEVEKFKLPFSLEAGMILINTGGYSYKIKSIDNESFQTTCFVTFPFRAKELDWNETAKANKIPWEDNVMYDYRCPISGDLFFNTDTCYCVNLIGVTSIEKSNEGDFSLLFAYFKKGEDASNFTAELIRLKLNNDKSLNDIELFAIEKLGNNTGSLFISSVIRDSLK